MEAYFYVLVNVDFVEELGQRNAIGHAFVKAHTLPGEMKFSLIAFGAIPPH
jgi:hypothetical protein